MRFIPTKFHAPLDYIVGAALIAAPWIFQFSEHTAATVVPIVLGIGLIVYSLFTNYELGVWKVAPMAVHNLIDIVAGAVLAASPWLFGFADESANVWVPHLVVGLAAIFLGLTTKQQGGYSYRKDVLTPREPKPNLVAGRSPQPGSGRLIRQSGAPVRNRAVG
jgi:hypothetical protein